MTSYSELVTLTFKKIYEQYAFLQVTKYQNIFQMQIVVLYTLL